jgi:tetratricopeptide (TPR) repeat protein
MSESSPQKMVSQRAALLIAVVSCAAGAGITGLLKGGDQSAQTPSYVISRPEEVSSAPAQEAGASGNAMMKESAAQPDFSQLPPAESALQQGNWNYDQQNWVRAIENYQRALSLGLDNADVRTDLGNAFRFSGDPQKALEQYRIAQRQNPQHETSFFNTATLYSKVLNDRVNAILAFQEYLRRFPNGEKASTAKQLLNSLSLRTQNAEGASALQKPTPELP